MLSTPVLQIRQRSPNHCPISKHDCNDQNVERNSHNRVLIQCGPERAMLAGEAKARIYVRKRHSHGVAFWSFPCSFLLLRQNKSTRSVSYTESQLTWRWNDGHLQETAWHRAGAGSGALSVFITGRTIIVDTNIQSSRKQGWAGSHCQEGKHSP
jgi:hypothetical protein